MLIARAPLRISFAGGGTDLPAYFEQRSGLVVNVTIDRYFYVVLRTTLDGALQITSSDFRMFERLGDAHGMGFDGDLGYVKRILNGFGVRRGLSVFTASESLPGTGLGSSGAVAVALVKALSALCGRRPTSYEVADLATYFEVEVNGRPIGLQDQYAASFGGLNVFRFERDEVIVDPIKLDLDARDAVERSVMLFYTGQSRDAARILREQGRATRHDASVRDDLDGIRQDAEEMAVAVRGADVPAMGRIIGASWERKKRLAHGITNPFIDRLYAAAVQSGAFGGKIAGAGGGGYLLLICPGDRQRQVTNVLEGMGAARVSVHFDEGGAQVLVNAMPELPSLRYPVRG